MSAIIALIRSASERGVTLPDTTKPHRLAENVGAAQLELSADDLVEATPAPRPQLARLPQARFAAARPRHARAPASS